MESLTIFEENVIIYIGFEGFYEEYVGIFD